MFLSCSHTYPPVICNSTISPAKKEAGCVVHKKSQNFVLSVPRQNTNFDLDSVLWMEPDVNCNHVIACAISIHMFTFFKHTCTQLCKKPFFVIGFDQIPKSSNSTVISHSSLESYTDVVAHAKCRQAVTGLQYKHDQTNICVCLFLSIL